MAKPADTCLLVIVLFLSKLSTDLLSAREQDYVFANERTLNAERRG